VDVVFFAEAIGAVEFDAGDEDGGEVGGGRGLEEVGGYVDFVVSGAEDAGFVEEGVVGGSGCGEEEGVCWGRADELSEGDIVLQEGYLVGGVDGRSEGY
jgi:hypothetical protein